METVGHIGLFALTAVYLLCALLLFLYGANCYVLLFLFMKSRGRRASGSEAFAAAFRRTHDDASLPGVTTQLPLYNERYVVERLIDAVAAIDYPREKHLIQVLDDSNDETSAIAARRIAQLRDQGVRIEHIRRPTREGYKAGALRYGLERTTDEFVAIFDADFIPPASFLRMTVPYLVTDARCGTVQTRWTHINATDSWLSIAEAIAMDTHFAIEQSARGWNGLYMNFNGTAGVWRRQAIIDAGNWQADTLTEDIDLSYRAQLANWHMRFVFDLETPGELPIDVNAFKTQQHRWAKGSIQTAIKILPRVFASDDSLFRKLQAFFHLTYYCVYPLILVMVCCTLPVLFFSQQMLPVWAWVLLLACFATSFVGSTAILFCAQYTLHRNWLQRILYLPWVMCVGVGLTVNNAKAVVEALAGHKTGFVRTPKRGGIVRGALSSYAIPATPVTAVELLLGLYSLLCVVISLAHHQYMVTYFVLCNAAGFLYIGLLSLLESPRARPAAQGR
ncbi:glycosyltransferase [bacterium]|nr:glycosyltransferase [bacterium]